MGPGYGFGIMNSSTRHGPHPRVTLVKGEWEENEWNADSVPALKCSHNQCNGYTGARGGKGEVGLAGDPFVGQVELVCHSSPQMTGGDVLIFTS